MRVACTSCGKAIQIADEKVPARTFTVTCPSCKTKQSVDPRAAADPAPTPTATAAPVAPAAPSAPPAKSAKGGSGATGTRAARNDSGALPALRPADAALLAELEPDAFLVDLGSRPSDGAVAALETAGARTVRRFPNLEEAVAALAETPAGILLVRVDKLSPPPAEELAPLRSLPTALRRNTFVAVEADNVRSLDGQVAFLLQVNCLLASADAAEMPLLLRRAVLHHLRLYRHWDEAMRAG